MIFFLIAWVQKGGFTIFILGLVLDKKDLAFVSRMKNSNKVSMVSALKDLKVTMYGSI